MTAASSLTTPATCSTDATSASSVGTYSTSCSGAVDSNYTVNYVNGNMVVGVAPLVITASSASMTYGASAPSVTPSYDGFRQRGQRVLPRHRADLLDDRLADQPRGQLQHLLLGGRRPELFDQLRERHGRCRSGPDHDHRIFGDGGLRLRPAVGHPDRFGSPERRGFVGARVRLDLHDRRGEFQPCRELRHAVLGCGRPQLRH